MHMFLSSLQSVYGFMCGPVHLCNAAPKRSCGRAQVATSQWLVILADHSYIACILYQGTYFQVGMALTRLRAQASIWGILSIETSRSLLRMFDADSMTFAFASTLYPRLRSSRSQSDSLGHGLHASGRCTKFCVVDWNLQSVIPTDLARVTVWLGECLTLPKHHDYQRR